MGKPTVPVAATKCELGGKMFPDYEAKGDFFPLKMMQRLQLHLFFGKVLGSQAGFGLTHGPPRRNHRMMRKSADDGTPLQRLEASELVNP